VTNNVLIPFTFTFKYKLKLQDSHNCYEKKAYIKSNEKRDALDDLPRAFSLWRH